MNEAYREPGKPGRRWQVCKTLIDVSDNKVVTLTLGLSVTIVLCCLVLSFLAGIAGEGIIRAWKSPPGWVEPPKPPVPCVDGVAVPLAGNGRATCTSPGHVMVKELYDEKEVWVCRCHLPADAGVDVSEPSQP